MAFWLVYGFAIAAPAVILPNALTFLLILSLFALKILHSAAETSQPEH